jgi:aspartate/methionine/tyrosine aminotransferase
MTDRTGPGIRLAARARSVIEPPIALFKERHRDHLQDRDLIDLSQAVPSHPPPPPVSDTIAMAAWSPAAHLYSPDPGLPECRDAIAGYLRTRHGARVTAEQVLVTPGANAAFHFAAAALVDPGERVALLSPYYFNHAMSIELLGSISGEIPWLDSLPLDAVGRSGAKVLVLVTPGNPTGRTLDAGDVERALAWAPRCGVTLVFDETYLEFPARGAGPVTALAFPGWQDCAVVIGSFSKSLAVTGHRVGYLCGAPEVLREVLKVQDSVVICAPRIGQLAVTAALGWSGLDAWLAERRTEIAERVTAFAAAMREASGDFTVEHSGAFFAWLRHAPVDPARLRSRLQAFGHYGEPSPAGDLVADLLLHEARVLTLPGGSSGVLGLDRVRVAVGNAAPDRLQEAAERIQRVAIGPR